jgi:hypothetical protein
MAHKPILAMNTTQLPKTKIWDPQTLSGARERFIKSLIDKEQQNNQPPNGRTFQSKLHMQK